MKFLIADDHNLFTEGFTLLLSQEYPETEFIQCSSLYQAVEALSEHPNTDILFADLNMPGMAGVSSLFSLRIQYPSLPICIVSADSSQQQIKTILESGISGYITKCLDGDSMKQAVKTILDGGIYTPPINAPVLHATTSNAINLTPRQIEALKCLSQGLCNKEISRELAISELTLKSHLKAVFKSLGVKNRTEASIKARELGLV